jgi:Tfp pilus assembly protein PilZ
MSHRPVPAPRYPAHLKVSMVGVPGYFAGEATNISSTGMFVRTDTAVSVGAVLSLSLEIPHEDRPVPVHARVIHVRTPAQALRSASHLDPGVGMQFVGAEAFQPIIDRYIESIPRESGVAAVRLLSRAKDLLARHGWTQLLERDPGGSYCLTGALQEAAGEDEDLYRRALRSLGPRLGVPACPMGGYACHCAVIGWNDQLGRTRSEVLAKIDEAIRAELLAAPAV